MSRVTRLGEFSPIWAKCVLLEKYRSIHRTSNVSTYLIVLTKKWFGSHFGRFFINSFGHPDAEQYLLASRKMDGILNRRKQQNIDSTQSLHRSTLLRSRLGTML
jgi:hypothetical protein